MDLALQTWQYALTHLDELHQATLDHLLLVSIAMFVSILVCIPLGVWTSHTKHRLSNLPISTVSGLRVVPSLAILFLLVPYMGVGLDTAIIALTVLAMPPILINTDTAFRTISPAVKESATGMGMTQRDILRKIEFPLALPIILTGIRTASTEVIASATLAAFIGSGGLGLFVHRGYAMYRMPILFVGAIPIALLVLASELLLATLQRSLKPWSA